jgi:hypothetical protein
MTSDPAAMTDEQVQCYREAVAALIAASIQRLRNTPLPPAAEPEPLGVAHE